MNPDEESFRSRVKRTPAYVALTALATAGGLGLSPFAPGTAGTLAGVGIYALIATAAPATYQVWILLAVLLCVGAVSVPLAAWAETAWGRKDPGSFVLDEVAGVLLVFVLFSGSSTALTSVWGFAAFRLFDIIKPPPVRRLEKLPGGWGILVDDLAAGVYGAVVLHVIAMVAPGLIGATAG